MARSRSRATISSSAAAASARSSSSCRPSSSSPAAATPNLRGRETVATLAALAAGGWIDAAARDELTAAYDFLRRVEHRLQMVADEQTHTLPAEREALERLRALSRLRRPRRFRRRAADASAHGREALCQAVRKRAGIAGASSRTCRSRPPKRERARRSIGLRKWAFASRAKSPPPCGAGTPARYRALRGEQARKNLTELVPVIIDQFARAENPDAAFAAFDRFLAGLRAGGRLLSLLRQNPELIRFIALILGAAPRLADILAQHPHVIDPLIDPSFFGALPDARAARERSLRESLGESARLRGFARCDPPVRPGAHVPDRRAHSVRLGFGGAGRRSVRRPGRRAASARCTPASRPISPPRTAASAARRPRSSRSAGSARAR